MKRISTIIALGLIAVLVAACGTVGNGEVIEESGEVGGFDKIELSGVGIVRITQGESEALSISAESNLMPLLVAEVRGTTLVIGEQSNANIRPTRDIVFTVTVIDLSRVEVSGAGRIEIAGLDTDALTIEVSGVGDISVENLSADTLNLVLSGAGQVNLSGNVREQTVTLSGAGNYEARNLQSETAQITLSGAGNAVVSVSDELSGNISGAGNVSYIGNPNVNILTSGLGRVNRVDE